MTNLEILQFSGRVDEGNHTYISSTAITASKLIGP